MFDFITKIFKKQNHPSPPNTVRFKCKEKSCGAVIEYTPEKSQYIIFPIFSIPPEMRFKRYDVYLKCGNDHVSRYWYPDDEV